MHGNQHENRGGFLRSRANWVLLAFIVIAGFYLVTEHRAHLFGYLPWLLLLACPFLHLFMHGGVPRRPHQHHLVVALFDAATGARITDADVTALVSGAGHRDDRKRLEAMVIADTTTYGQYFDFPDAGRYTIRVDVRRGNQAAPVTARFTYQHSLR